jgi:hypothetical protein
VSNLKVQRDYYKAVEVVLQRTQPRRENEFESNNIRIMDNRVEPTNIIRESRICYV